MLKEGYKYGQGLGKNGQGPVHPLKLTENKGRYGLGYKPYVLNFSNNISLHNKFMFTYFLLLHIYFCI